MSAQELLFEQIELYLEKKMSPEEAASFEARMAADSFLLASVNLHRDLARVITDKEEIALEEKLQRIGRDFFSNSSPKRLPLWQNRYWMIAASIILLATVGMWFLFSGPTAPNHEQLFALHYSPYTIPDGFQGLRDASSSTPDSLTIAVSQYEKKDYAMALKSFEELSPSSLNTPLVQICVGICYLQTGEISMAKEKFSKLLETENNFFKSPAQWYLALSLLKEGNQQAAREILESLENDPGKYGKLARDLMGNM